MGEQTQYNVDCSRDILVLGSFGLRLDGRETVSSLYFVTVALGIFFIFCIYISRAVKSGMGSRTTEMGTELGHLPSFPVQISYTA